MIVCDVPLVLGTYVLQRGLLPRGMGEDRERAIANSNILHVF